jgi:hypothetical protein
LPLGGGFNEVRQKWVEQQVRLAVGGAAQLLEEPLGLFLQNGHVVRRLRGGQQIGRGHAERPGQPIDQVDAWRRVGALQLRDLSDQHLETLETADLRDEATIADG